MNPILKRESIIRDMRQFQGRFNSVIDMKVRLIEEFGEQLPQTTTFSIGYFAGRQSAKYWICTDEDLSAMYTNCHNDEIMLWCDGRSDDGEAPKNKRRKTGEGFLSKREEKEQKVDDLTEELKDLNKDKLDLSEVQYRLWARMISTGIHSSKDTPPQIPMITGVTPKRKQRVDEDRRTLQDSIVSTAAAVVKAVNSGQSTLVQSPSIQQTIQDSSTPDRSKSRPSQLGISPGKAADIRGKSFSQLNALKQLYDDHVLTEEEFEEQKSVILSGLKKLQ